MAVRVRMAPSPTGALHVGGVRTALFNWLFARNQGGEFLVRIENTDTSREVQGAVDHALESLAWLGLDWDRPPTFQLDRQEDCGEVARRLVADGKAYEDEGAVRFRMPDEGVTAWDDVVKGRIEFPNDGLDDLVILRSDGRPTYNFASPMEDVWDGITHVIRGDDHISNTPKQINIIRAVGAELPVYAHVPNVLATDGRKLSKRHGATGVDELRAEGYVAPALLNFLALLGWSYDDRTTVMTRDELIERFSLDRVIKSPAAFDYTKLAWMNGVYLRAMAPGELADVLVEYLRDQGYAWPEETVRASAPLVQEKIDTLGAFPSFAGFLFGEVEPDPAQLDGGGEVLREAIDALEALEPFDAERIESALRGLAERLELSPRKAFQPIRVAVTGSKVSPGLFESLELLGRERTLARLSSAAAVAA
jgi:glutamyl-tRNA synthetase